MDERRYDAVLFDLDGTLIDSLPAIRAAMAQVCADLDLPVPDVATVGRFVGGGVAVAMARLLDWAEADPALRPRAVATMRDAYAKVPTDLNAVLPGARAVLDHLAARDVPTGLCTNKPRAPTEDILAALSLGPFAVTVCGDDLPLNKPDPAPLLACCARIGVAAGRCLFVGDSEIDHAAAAGAGMPFAFVAGGYLNAPLRSPEPRLRLPNLDALLDEVQAFPA